MKVVSATFGAALADAFSRLSEGIVVPAVEDVHRAFREFGIEPHDGRDLEFHVDRSCAVDHPLDRCIAGGSSVDGHNHFLNHETLLLYRVLSS